MSIYREFAMDDAQVKGIVKVDFLEEAALENIRDAVMVF